MPQLSRACRRGCGRWVGPDDPCPAASRSPVSVPGRCPRSPRAARASRADRPGLVDATRRQGPVARRRRPDCGRAVRGALVRGGSQRGAGDERGAWTERWPTVATPRPPAEGATGDLTAGELSRGDLSPDSPPTQGAGGGGTAARSGAAGSPPGRRTTPTSTRASSVVSPPTSPVSRPSSASARSSRRRPGVRRRASPLAGRPRATVSPRPVDLVRALRARHPPHRMGRV